MNFKKTIEWEIEENHLYLESLGFSVNVYEDKDCQKNVFSNNTFKPLSDFLYEDKDTGNFLNYPIEGLTPQKTFLSQKIRTFYEPYMLVSFGVVMSQENVYRVSSDGSSILDSLNVYAGKVKYIATDKTNNEIWVTMSNGVVLISSPQLDKKTKTIQISREAFAIIPDGNRKVFWEITTSFLFLKNYLGETIRKWSVVFEINEIISYQILNSTGDVYFLFGTNDPNAASDKFLIFINFPSQKAIVNNSLLPEIANDLSEWGYNSVLSIGDDGTICRWQGHSYSKISDISSHIGVPKSIISKKNERIYILDDSSKIYAFSALTFNKEWEFDSPFESSKFIGVNFEKNVPNRILLLRSEDSIFSLNDLGSEAFLVSNNLKIDTFLKGPSAFGVQNQAQVATIKINPIQITDVEDSSSSSSSVEEEGWEFYFNELTGEAKITGYTGRQLELKTPSFVKKYLITEIEDSAFENHQLFSIEITENVKKIGDKAFKNCLNLESVEILNGVYKIGSEAFSGCEGLVNFFMGNDVSWLGDRAFLGCKSLHSLSLSPNIQEIKNNTFSRCTNLYEVIMPNGIFKIGSSSFFDCISLSSVSIPSETIEISHKAFVNCSFSNIEIPQMVEKIGSGAFLKCKSLVNFFVEENNLFYESFEGVLIRLDFLRAIASSSSSETSESRDLLVQYPPAKLASYFSIPKRISVIGVGAFKYCNNLESIEIGDHVVEISDAAFQNCANLEAITIGSGIKHFGDNVFDKCPKLGVASLRVVPDFLFKNIESLETVDIEDNVKEIGESSFEGCESLNVITIGESVESVGDYSFAFCPTLTNVEWRGDQPAGVGRDIYKNSENVINIVREDANGWGDTFGGRPVQKI